MSTTDIISRDDLGKLIKDLFNTYDPRFTQIFVSREPIFATEVKDSFGTRVFENLESLKGWLVFVDPLKVANWSHRCEYWFIINKDHITSNKSQQWKPDNSIAIDII